MENQIAQVLVHIANQQQTDRYHLWNLRTPAQSPSHWVISHQLDVKDHPSPKPVLALISSSSHFLFA